MSGSPLRALDCIYGERRVGVGNIQMMQRTGTADLPLHGGRAPRWLFGRMVRLARAMVLAMREDRAPSAILAQLSDPFWFQAFGCVLGFDWFSSGLTTTVCGAIKEGLRGLEGEVGLFVAGGKGATSRRTPREIAAAAERLGVTSRRSLTRAAWRRRSTVRPSKMATSSTITRLSSRRPLTGRWSSRECPRPPAMPAVITGSGSESRRSCPNRTPRSLPSDARAQC